MRLLRTFSKLFDTLSGIDSKSPLPGPISDRRRDRAFRAGRRSPQRYEAPHRRAGLDICPVCLQVIEPTDDVDRDGAAPCPSCQEPLYYRPNQGLFPSCWLGSRQEIVLRYLHKLDHGDAECDGRGTAGTETDYWWAALERIEDPDGGMLELPQETRGTEDEASEAPVLKDLLWKIFHDNQELLNEIFSVRSQIDQEGDPEQEASRRRRRDSSLDVLWTLMEYNFESMDVICPQQLHDRLPSYAAALQRWMRELQSEEWAFNRFVRDLGLEGKAAFARARVPSGVDWRDHLRSLRGDPDAQLCCAEIHLPDPEAFRAARIAMREVVGRERRRRGNAESFLHQLYRQAALHALFLDGEAIDGVGPIVHVSEDIPLDEWHALDFPYRTLGYQHLDLAPIEIEWLVETWGEPLRHEHPRDLHAEFWSAAVERARQRLRVPFAH